MSGRLTFEHVVDPRTAAWRALMDVYTDAFEDAQRETEAGLLANLTTAETPREGGHVVIAAQASPTVCVGGIIFSYLPAINCGYASYVFVASAARRRGVGTRLLTEMQDHVRAEAARQGRPSAAGFFTEIQSLKTADAVTRARLQFWLRNGVRPLAVEWKYPPLRETSAPVPTYLAFGSYEDGPWPWRPGELERVARAIFESTYNYLPQAPATLASIIDGLRRLPQGRPVEYVTPA